MAFYLQEGDRIRRIHPDGTEEYLGLIMSLKTAGDNFCIWLIRPGKGINYDWLLVQPDGVLVDYPEEKIEYRLPIEEKWRQVTEPRKEMVMRAALRDGDYIGIGYPSQDPDGNPEILLEGTINDLIRVNHPPEGWIVTYRDKNKTDRQATIDLEGNIKGQQDQMMFYWVAGASKWITLDKLSR
ncbi:MAG: hypothetical protein ABIB97_00510 [Patescibacteria group bacterium]